MLLTSTSNGCDFEVMAAALLKQHPQAHLDDMKTPREGSNTGHNSVSGTWCWNDAHTSATFKFTMIHFDRMRSMKLTGVLMSLTQGTIERWT